MLHDAVGRAFLNKVHRRLLVERSGDEDDGRERALVPHKMQRVERGELRQGVIRQDNVRGELVQGAPQVGPALHPLRRATDPRATQLAEHQLRVGGDVLHHENPEWFSG